jgi:hypothetical protein
MSETFACRIPFPPPHGREAVYNFAGWVPDQFLRSDGTPAPSWEAAWIQRLAIPRPIAYLDGQEVTRIAVHRKAATSLLKALIEIDRDGLWHTLEPYGGGYVFRVKRGESKLSMHALGLAVDFDPARNPLGTEDLSTTTFGGTPEGRGVVRIFGLYGWKWGGDFVGRKDPMHFQFCTGI